jgi:hypothetical protein
MDMIDTTKSVYHLSDRLVLYLLFFSFFRVSNH